MIGSSEVASPSLVNVCRECNSKKWKTKALYIHDYTSRYFCIKRNPNFPISSDTRLWYVGLAVINNKNWAKYKFGTINDGRIFARYHQSNESVKFRNRQKRRGDDDIKFATKKKKKTFSQPITNNNNNNLLFVSVKCLLLNVAEWWYVDFQWYVHKCISYTRQTYTTSYVAFA